MPLFPKDVNGDRFPLCNHSAAGLVAAAAAATAEVAALLPQGTKIFMNSRTQVCVGVWVTLFLTPHLSGTFPVGGVLWGVVG